MNGIRRAAASEQSILRAGLAHAGALATVQKRALDVLLGSNERDAEAQGALAALTLGRHREAFHAFWLSQGAAFAIACATHERRFVAVHPKRGAGLDLSVRWIGWRALEQTPLTLDVATWHAMNAAFRKLKKDERPAAQAEVRAARGDLVLSLACWVDSMALLAEEAADDALRAVELPDDEWSAIEEWVSALVPALATRPSAATRKAALAIFGRGSGAGLVNRLAPHAKLVVGLLGSDAALPLAQLLDEARETTVVDPTAAKKVAQVLAEIDHPSVEPFFVRHVDSRLIGTVAAAFVASRDTTASDKAHARALAIHEAATTITKARSRRAKAAAKKTTARRKRTVAVVQAREAAPDELPWVLRSPPWQTRTLPALPTLALRPDRNDESDAPTMIAALRGARAELARKWLAAHPEESATALLSMLSSSPGSEVLEGIGILVREGHAPVFRSIAVRRGASEADADRIAEVAALFDCPDSAPELPAWAIPEKLPPVVLAGGARLGPEATTNLLEMLALIDAGKPYVGLAQVKRACDRTSLDALLVRIVELGGRKAEDWVTSAAASLGGPDTMRVLAKRVKEWNRDWFTRERAVAIVHAMRAGGLDAVGALSDVVRKVRGDPEEAAREVLQQIARDEGLSTEELADIATPSLDLDAGGRATLDFGTRKFHLSLGNDLGMEVTDEAGKRVAALRKQKSDDAAKAQVSLERSRSLKKALGEIARNAALRFEMGMIDGRTFRGMLFRTTLIAHPILGRLVRRLVWKRGRDLVRIAEDGTLASAGGERIEGSDTDVLCLPHPIALDAKTIRLWGDVLADHAIIQPFPQIGRLLFAPTDEETDAGQLLRFKGTPVKHMAIQGRLQARGWERLSSEGFTHGWFRRFASATAHYNLVDPIGPGTDFQTDTTLGPVSFSVPIAKVAPLIFSETAYDFHVFAD